MNQGHNACDDFRPRGEKFGYVCNELRYPIIRFRYLNNPFRYVNIEFHYVVGNFGYGHNVNRYARRRFRYGMDGLRYGDTGLRYVDEAVRYGNVGFRYVSIGLRYVGDGFRDQSNEFCCICDEFRRTERHPLSRVLVSFPLSRVLMGEGRGEGLLRIALSIEDSIRGRPSPCVRRSLHGPLPSSTTGKGVKTGDGVNACDGAVGGYGCCGLAVVVRVRRRLWNINAIDNVPMALAGSGTIDRARDQSAAKPASRPERF